MLLGDFVLLLHLSYKVSRGDLPRIGSLWSWKARNSAFTWSGWRIFVGYRLYWRFFLIDELFELFRLILKLFWVIAHPLWSTRLVPIQLHFVRPPWPRQNLVLVAGLIVQPDQTIEV